MAGKDSLILVQPETVIRWFREGFKRYWTRRSRRLVGRPGIDPELRSLVRTMAMANPLWGAPRIHGELLRLGLGGRSKPAIDGHLKTGHHG